MLFPDQADSDPLYTGEAVQPPPADDGARMIVSLTGRSKLLVTQGYTASGDTYSKVKSDSGLVAHSWRIE